MAEEKAEKLRPAVVAGQFYPEGKKELAETIEDLLAEAEPSSIKGEIFGLLLPHAGYLFSGQVAACGLKTVEGKDFDTVIIMGDSHCEYFDGVSFWVEGQWETPLGRVEVDKDLALKIMASSNRFLDREGAHLFEHSLEVQLPFLQKTLHDFKIVPIVFGSENKDWKDLAEAILNNIGNKKVLIIASSDLSHYPPYEEAKKEDLKTLRMIENLDTAGLDRELTSGFETFLCAKDSTKTLMEITKNIGGRAKILKYANSGDSAVGDKKRVVGYGAVAFYKEFNEKLNAAERSELLRIAKESVESLVKGEKVLRLETDFEKLKIPSGAFVTLKKNGKLRGCIGTIAANMPLYQTVAQMAMAAATQDYRFSPVTKEELPELEYEISVLTPPRKIKSPSEIKLGKHGVVAQTKKGTALFLPQVAEETKWDRETFLNHLMLKAGLEKEYWKKHPVDFYVFEAQVF